MWIGEVSSGQAHPFEKHGFGQVTFLIGWNVMTPYSKIFPGATAHVLNLKRIHPVVTYYKQQKMWEPEEPSEPADPLSLPWI